MHKYLSGESLPIVLYHNKVSNGKGKSKNQKKKIVELYVRFTARYRVYMYMCNSITCVWHRHLISCIWQSQYWYTSIVHNNKCGHILGLAEAEGQVWMQTGIAPRTNSFCLEWVCLSLARKQNVVVINSNWCLGAGA